MNNFLIQKNTLSNDVIELILNDPGSKNAMSEEMGVVFKKEIEILAKDPSLKVLVLKGAGDAFSAGGHLDMLFDKTKLTPAENKKNMQIFYDYFLSIVKIPVPVIAAINGHAVGAGLCLALACDIRIANENAKLGLNFVRLGLHPGMGVTYFLPRIVGINTAARLMYSGKIMQAAEAKELGMVDLVVPESKFKDEVNNAISDILAGGSDCIRELKESLRDSMTNTLKECLEREADCQAIDYNSKQFLEGITAAKEKRKPVW